VRNEKRIDAVVVRPDAENVVLVDADGQLALPNPSPPDLVSIPALVKKNVVGSQLQTTGNTSVYPDLFDFG